MVFQENTLLPWLTAAENVGLYFTFRRRMTQEDRAWVQELLRLAGLEKFARSYPYQLSGGMKRRVAFLAGVAARPELVLLDEPFSSVDEPSRVRIHQDVLRIASSLDMTMVLVTHDLAEAITLCDEVIILSARPGAIYATHRVPFGHIRNVVELRATSEYLELYGELWRDLGLQIQTASSEE